MSTEHTDDCPEARRLREELEGMADVGRKARDHYTEQIDTLQQALLELGGYPAGSTWPGNHAAIAAAQAALQRVTKWANGNGAQARFWADHFQEVQAANRRALGARHQRGYPVAELIAAVVAELSDYERQYAEQGAELRTERAQFERVLTALLPAPGQVNGLVSGIEFREQAGDLVRRLVHQRNSLQDDVDVTRGMISAHVGESLPPDVTTRQAVQTVLEEIADLRSQLAEADAEADAVLAERDHITGDAEDLHLLHSIVSDSEDELRAAGHRIAGLFNRDPEDHQVAGVLREIAEELIAWRTDPTCVPQGWQSLVRKGWAVGASRLAVPADAEMRIGTLLSAFQGEQADVVAVEVVRLISSPGWRLPAATSAVSDVAPAEHPDCTRTGMCPERHDHAPECLSQFRTDAELANGVYPPDEELAARSAVYDTAAATTKPGEA
jgi:hypothetical protein